MRQRFIRKTTATVTPVTVSQLKRHLRIPDAQKSEDAALNDYIIAATSMAEKFLDFAICSGTFVVWYEYFSGQRIQAGFNFSTVSSVNYFDDNEEQQSAIFSYDQDTRVIRLDDEISATDLKITGIAGQNSGWDEGLISGIIMIAADLYAGRTSGEYISEAATMRLMPYRNRPIL